MSDPIITNQDSTDGSFVSESAAEPVSEVISDSAVKANLDFVPEETTVPEPIISPNIDQMAETSSVVTPVIEPNPESVAPPVVIPDQISTEVKSEPVISTETDFSSAHTTPKTLEQAQPQTELEAAGFVKPSSGFMAWLRSKARAVKEFRKRQKLEKIMKLFDKKTEITNDIVEKLLHVSDGTATKYLKILVSENKIKRSVDNGRATTYQKI